MNMNQISDDQLKEVVPKSNSFGNILTNLGWESHKRDSHSYRLLKERILHLGLDISHIRPGGYVAKFSTDETKERIKNRSRLSSQRRRKDKAQRASIILSDSKRCCKRRNLQHNITKDLIQLLIDKGCTYCGEKELQIGLDRKDSSIGYIETNIEPCCIRCNLSKRDMPYEAWLLISKGFREARELGLFGQWTGDIWSKRKITRV